MTSFNRQQIKSKSLRSKYLESNKKQNRYQTKIEDLEVKIGNITASEKYEKTSIFKMLLHDGAL